MKLKEIPILQVIWFAISINIQFVIFVIKGIIDILLYPLQILDHIK